MYSLFPETSTGLHIAVYEKCFQAAGVFPFIGGFVNYSGIRSAVARWKNLSLLKLCYFFG